MKTKMKHTTGQIATAPAKHYMTTKPEKVSKKILGPKKIVKKKISRQASVGMKTTPEDQMRKTMRQKQGLC